jgi:hypothetical protein
MLIASAQAVMSERHCTADVATVHTFIAAAVVDGLAAA